MSNHYEKLGETFRRNTERMEFISELYDNIVDDNEIEADDKRMIVASIEHLKNMIVLSSQPKSERIPFWKKRLDDDIKFFSREEYDSSKTGCNDIINIINEAKEINELRCLLDKLTLNNIHDKWKQVVMKYDIYTDQGRLLFDLELYGSPCNKLPLLLPQIFTPYARDNTYKDVIFYDGPCSKPSFTPDISFYVQGKEEPKRKAKKTAPRRVNRDRDTDDSE